MIANSATRRELLKSGLASVTAGLTMLSLPQFVFPGQTDDEELVPFENVPRSKPESLDWETLTEWVTPQDQVFSVQHYDVPEVKIDDFALEIAGLVDHPLRLTLPEIKALPAEEQFMTLECSGNGSSPGFSNAVYNSRWKGTRLAPLLEKCGVQAGAIEVVFFCHDRKTETLRPGTPRELSVEVPFGRSLSLTDAVALNPLLAYERNGEPLAVRNGAPLRLIVPGWYGIANVKWLRRIEVRDRRYMGRYMGRDYVTIRGEKQGDEVVFVESSVTRMNLKSVIARVTRRPAVDGKVPLKAYGAVWGDGTPIEKVEVQFDGGEWKPATIDPTPFEKYSWRFFSIDLGNVEPGKHTLVSRGIDANGRIQPSAQDDEIALKKTYWEAYEQWPREINIEA
jgi:DMSO/TMAO reductase YedYZ molybdopterin-dependent catalytic subunit